MRVLITHQGFAWFAGTETYMLTVAEQLVKSGHDVRIYAEELGAMAELAEHRGVNVGDHSSLPDSCDLVLAQDAATCLEMWQRYPDALRIFTAHSEVHMLQAPPQLPGSYDALVVLNSRMERWAQGLAWRPKCVRLRQPVDLERFRLTPPPRSSPMRLLVLSHFPFGTRAQIVADACADAGWELRWKGGQHGAIPHPEDDIAASTAVLGIGRSALDAMASARATLVLGPLAGDGWVTAENYSALEADGFTGRATDRALDRLELVDELRRWTPALGLTSRELVSGHHDARHHARELIVLARELQRVPSPPTGVERELARLVRLEWQRTQTVIDLRRDNVRLQAELDDKTRALAELEQATTHHQRHAEQALEQLELFRATKRYRIAQALGWPLDRLRRFARRSKG